MTFCIWEETRRILAGDKVAAFSNEVETTMASFYTLYIDCFLMGAYRLLSTIFFTNRE